MLFVCVVPLNHLDSFFLVYIFVVMNAKSEVDAKVAESIMPAIVMNENSEVDANVDEPIIPAGIAHKLRGDQKD